MFDAWRRILWQTAHRSLKPRPWIPVSAWADANRIIPPGTSPEPGPWLTSRVPYLREPMDACNTRGPSFVVLMFSSQVGKTEALLNVQGFFAAQEPSSQLMLQPTLDAAEAFSRERLEPTIRATPALSAVIDQRERQRGTTKLRKDYPGGYIALVGTNSPAGLASRPIRVLLCDETDRYVETREGDPVALAIQRTANFPTRRIVLASTPTISGASCIESWYLRGDQREFRVACQACGHRFALTWPLVRWETAADGEPDPLSAHIDCPTCGARVRGSGKPSPALLASGVWTPTAKSAEGIRSYHLSALYSPWVHLSSLVAAFCKVTRSRDKAGLREFVNLSLGEPWDDQTSQAVSWQDLRDRCETYHPDALPSGALILTAGVDVQRDRLEVSIWAWGCGKESWAVEHRLIFGAPESPQVWRDLEACLAEVRTRSGDGARLPVACTFIDSGDGVTTRDVYAFARRHEAERVFACKGRGGSGIPLVMPPRHRNPDGVLLVHVGVDAAKEAILSRFSIVEPGPGRVHFPARADLGFSEEYFRQLTAEVLVRKRRGNVVSSRWQKTRERNEALDCAVYSLAALELLHPDLEAMSAAASGAASASEAAASAAPVYWRRRPSSKGVEL